MSEFQDISRCLLAAGSAEATDNQSTYFVYTEGSSLILKEWTGKSFTHQTTIAESVRPGSVAAYILTPTIETIVYIDSSSRLRVINFDYDRDDWGDPDNTQLEVQPDGRVTACLTESGPLVLFQNPKGLLVMFYLGNHRVVNEIPKVVPIPNSPLSVNYIQGTLHVFYMSKSDNCIHCAIGEKAAWKDKKWTNRPFDTTIVQFVVKHVSQNHPFAYVLTGRREMLHVARDGTWERLGTVDVRGNFLSARTIDLFCLDVEKNTLTEERLREYLSTNPAIINTVGGEPPSTPLATACWNGNLDAVRLLLDNRYRRADANALSGNRTPLYYAVTRSPVNRKEIVSALLDGGARIDDCSPKDDQTPLMHAIIQGDKGVIRELVSRGASLTVTDRRGQTAVMMAEGAGLERLLRPPRRPPSVQTALIDIVVGIVTLIIAYYNNSDFVRELVDGVVIRLREVTEPREDD